MKDLVNRENLSNEFYIASAATSTEEIGNPVYPPIKEIMVKHGVPFENHRAKQLKQNDYNNFDLFVAMDENNLRNIHRIFPSDKDGKIKKLLSFCGSDRDVADPWYYGNFEQTYGDILSGCTALLESLI